MVSIMRVRTVLSGFTGAPGLNTFYFRPGTVGGSVADATDVCARVRAFWNGIAGILPSTMIAATAAIADVIDDTTGTLVGAFASTTPPTAVAGSGAGEAYAPQVAALLQLNTASFFSGRRIQGRSFISPLTEAAILGGVVPVATVSTITGSALTNLTPGAPPTSSALQVWRRPRGATPGASYIVTAFAVPVKTATLKSRRDS